MTSSVVTGSFGLTIELPDDPINIMHLGLAMEVTNDHVVDGNLQLAMEVPDCQHSCLCLLSAVCLEKNQLRTLSTKFSAQREIYLLPWGNEVK